MTVSALPKTVDGRSLKRLKRIKPNFCRVQRRIEAHLVLAINVLKAYQLT